MEITLLGIHSSYGIRLWKYGIISQRTTTIALPWLTLLPEDTSRSRCRWHLDKVLDPHSIFLFALNRSFFFVWLGIKHISIYIKKFVVPVLLYSEYVFIKLN